VLIVSHASYFAYFAYFSRENMPRWTKNCKAEIWLRQKFRDGSLKQKDVAKTVYDDNLDIFSGYKYPTYYKHFSNIKKEECK